MLTDKRNKFYVRIHIFLLVTTIIAIVGIILENISYFDPYSKILLIIEWSTVLIFTAEYIARIASAKNKLKYIFSLWGIIDVVSILPTLLGLGDWAFLKSIRIVRIMRIIRGGHIGKLKEDYLDS